jgi:thiol:disulfide interchange protein DsbD
VTGLRAFVAAAVVLFALAAPSAAQAPGPFAVTPVAESATAHAGTTVRLAAILHIPPGLHAQSNAPGDSNIPMQLTIDATPGVTDLDRAFPAPVTFTLKGTTDVSSVFGGDVAIGVRVALDKTIAPGPLTIPAHLRYQACDDSQCFFPRTVTTSWTLQIVPAATPVPAEHADVFGNMKFGPSTAATPATATPAVASVPAIGDPAAMLDRFEIAGSSNGYQTVSEFQTFIHNAETGVTSKGMFEGQGPLAILALVFIGGLALNLTPCVLPMIPINLAIIGAGSQSGGRRGRGFLLGSVYGGAMALAYGVLGLIVILTAGTFGAINSSAWFNFGIAVLFVWLALAMFDVVSLDPSRWSSKIRFDEKSRGTVYLAFAMGTIAAVLAGACVAPVVVQVVVFASQMYAGGTHAALALPFVLGLGMAIPWPLAGAGFAALPKPGAWMVRVKQAFGVFILAMAAYYGYEGYTILSSRWVDPAAVKASAEAQIRAGWHADLAEGLAAAERDKTLVLVDLWATWCKNCLVMDRTTMVDPSVTQALAAYTRIKFQAEDADDPRTRAVMQRLGAVGLPTYVILKPKSLAR